MKYQFNWYVLTFALIAQIILIITISPLIPDLDHEQGKLVQILMGTGFILALIGAIYWWLTTHGLSMLGNGWQTLLFGGLSLAGFTFLTTQILHHRGLLHSIVSCLIYGTAIFLITGFNYQLGSLATIGCYSHLVADKLFLKVI